MKLVTFTCCLTATCLSGIAYGQALPGPADAGRVARDKAIGVPFAVMPALQKPTMPPVTDAPKEANTITVRLTAIHFEGMSVFKPEDFADLYQPYLNHETSLATLWQIAGAVTERYRAAGYFLSRAIVPPQEIGGGNATIKVVEGSISEVELQGKVGDSAVVQSIIRDIRSAKPARLDTLERDLMLLNDLPGVSFTSVIAPLSEKQPAEDSVKLVLVPQVRKGVVSVSADNYGSRYLGPYQLTANYQGSIIPLEKTSMAYSMTPDTKELKYLSLAQDIPIWKALTLQLSGNYTLAQPGFQLEKYDIKSKSADLSVGVKYDTIRRRQENLSFQLAFEGKNTQSDLLNTLLSKDRVRELNASAQYENSDRWQGSNSFTLGVSQGLDVLGARDKGAPNLSRSQAPADFRKGELSISRIQALSANWNAALSTSGQYASGPLPSTEEFGYGGQSFGRAYDPSEITGDHGIAASLELRYAGFRIGESTTIAPYMFYDIGKIWNEDKGQLAEASGSSAGLGIRAEAFGITGNLGIAQPLTRSIAAPQYGNGKNPRILMQIGYGF